MTVIGVDFFPSESTIGYRGIRQAARARPCLCAWRVRVAVAATEITAQYTHSLPPRTTGQSRVAPRFVLACRATNCWTPAAEPRAIVIEHTAQIRQDNGHTSTTSVKRHTHIIRFRGIDIRRAAQRSAILRSITYARSFPVGDDNPDIV